MDKELDALNHVDEEVDNAVDELIDPRVGACLHAVILVAPRAAEAGVDGSAAGVADVVVIAVRVLVVRHRGAAVVAERIAVCIGMIGRRRCHSLRVRAVTRAGAHLDSGLGAGRFLRHDPFAPGMAQRGAGLCAGVGCAAAKVAGGSLGSVSWSDDLVPRDTDPVSRSILGYINRPDSVDFSNSLFIIPLINDSMRKIAYQLKSEGKKICLADIPPSRNDKYAQENYTNQMKELCATVSAHTKSKVSKYSTVSAMKRVSNARAALARFLELSRGRTDIITDSARIFVQNSYYMTDSMERWTYHVESLSKEVAFYISQSKNKEYKRPSIMVAGSPVIFPNYKIPFLIRDAGLAIYDSADYITLKTLITYKRSMMYGSKDKLIENIALEWYRYDASPAYTQNDVLYEYISDTVKKGGIEGVVYHVLKGQIEYDFELEKIENMLSQYSIPVFRLETDYQYQDVEQLRIRMEAFSEMLVQNRYRKVKKVS